MSAHQTSNIIHRTPWRPPIASYAKGIKVYLQDGREIIDGAGGAAVAALGMGHPQVVKAIQDQVEKMAYVYNMQLSNEPAEELASLLCRTSKGVFETCTFVSGGSEATDSALKLARQYWVEVGQPQRKNFIARKLSYHGNTLGALSLSHHPGRKEPYNPILNNEAFHHVSPAYAVRFKQPDETEEAYVIRLAQELENKIKELGPETVIGFVAETVVGATTGAVPPPKGYFRAVKSICEKYNILFILDEVMCGMGRMGSLHAWERFGDGAAPDIQTCAKGLAAGYQPLGAVLLGGKVSQALKSGSGFMKHGFTYQANPLACAAAVAVQKVIVEEDLLSRCQESGELLSSLLRKRLASPSPAAPYIFDIRGGGLFWGIEFSGHENKYRSSSGERLAIKIQARCLEKGLIVMGFSGGADLEGVSGEHLLLAPALNCSATEIEAIVDRVVASIESVVAEFQA